MDRWEDFVSSAYLRVLLLIAFVAVVMGVVERVLQPVLLEVEMAGVREAFRVMVHVAAFTLTVLILFAFYQIAISKDIKDVITEVRDILEERLPKPKGSSSREGREERMETSGAGALAGMTLLGIVGLTLGLVGMIVGGILGGLIGNQIEYEIIRAKKRKKRSLEKLS